MKKITGWFIYNGYLNSQKFFEMNEIYRLTALKKNINLEFVANNELHMIIDNNNSILKTKNIIQNPDFILFLDKDIKLARHLELIGYRVFNSSSAIEICDDKSLTYQALANKELSMPKTIISPFCYPNSMELDNNYYKFLEKELIYPFIVKEAFGSFGEQVYLINNKIELMSKRKEIFNKPHLYQEYIASSRGRDVRLNVVGNRVIASMLRTSDVDFRANVSNGGKMQKFDPPKEFIELAIKASHTVGASFSGVDILFGPDEEPILCEVNSNSHIKNILECTGINVADAIFDYIIEEIIS